MEDLKSILPDDYIARTPEQFKLLDDVIPTEVCHYTPMDTALEKILRDRRIRLSDITSTNDPRESKDRLYYYPVSNETGERSHFDDNQKKFLKEWRVFCTSCHNDPFEKFKSTFHFEKYGVAYSSMWAHYARHNGICLLFDGKNLDKNMQRKLREVRCEVRHGFVKYDYAKATALFQTNDKEFQGCERPEMIRKSQLKHYDENFLYKTPEWKYEHEFRWLIQSEVISDIFVSIENAIKAVVVGEDFNSVYEPSLKALCEALRISRWKIWWTNGTPVIIPL